MVGECDAVILNACPLQVRVHDESQDTTRHDTREHNEGIMTISMAWPHVS